MFFLLLSILTSTSLVLIFKLFGRYRIDNFQAIVVNYITAAILGLMVDTGGFNYAEIPSQTWFPNAIIFGILFIILFNIIALSTQKVGISGTSVANKMSLIIPVIAAGFLYGDTFNFVKISGIILAIPAVVLTVMNDSLKSTDRKYLFLPVLVFAGSGFLDTYFKYTQTYHLQESDMVRFITSLFLVSSFIGVVVLLIGTIAQGKKMELKNIIAGVLLGIPNYFSVYFLLKTLELKNIQSSVIFPINNMGIVIGAAMAALLLFGEKLSYVNWIGIGLSVISIILISFS